MVAHHLKDETENQMYFVGTKSFDDLSEAMSCCSSGSINDVVTDENGTILMEHKEVPIEDIFGLIAAHEVLMKQYGNSTGNIKI